MSVQDSLRACVGAVKAYYKENAMRMPDSEIAMAAKWLLDAGKDNMTKAEFGAELTKREIAYTKRVAKMERTQEVMNKTKAVKNIVNVQETAKAEIAAGGDRVAAPTKAFKASILGGYEKSWKTLGKDVTVKGLSQDIMAKEQAIKAKFQQFLARATGKLGDTARALPKTDKLFRDMFQDRDALLNGTNTHSGNPEAEQLARGMMATDNMRFKETQSVNALVQKTQGYLGPRSYDPEALRGMGKEAWTKKMLSRYGEKSFLGHTDAEKLSILGDMFDDIVSERTSVTDFRKKSFIKALDGPSGDLAKKMAPHRVLTANNWQADYDSMVEFGKHPMTAMVDSLNSAARKIAVMDRWGGNPEQNLDYEINAHRKAMDPEQRAYFDDRIKQIRAAYEVSMGSQQGTATTLKARATQASLSWSYATWLGKHVFRAQQDISNIMTKARGTFGTLPESAYKIAFDVEKGILNGAPNREYLLNTHVFTSEVARDGAGTLLAPDSDPSLLQKALKTMGKISGADNFTSALKAKMALLDTKGFGELLHYSHEQLPYSVKDTLARHGFGPHEWDYMRLAQESMDWGGEQRALLTPDGIEKIQNDTAAEIYLRKTNQWAGKGQPPRVLLDRPGLIIARDYATMLNSRAADVAGLTSLADRYNLHKNTSINDPAEHAWALSQGQMSRLRYQFLAPAVVNSRIAREAALNGQTTGGALGALTSHLVRSMFFTAIGEYALQAIEYGVSGKPVESPLSFSMAAKMVAGSAGLGIPAEIVMHAAQMGKSPMDAVKNAATQAYLGAAGQNVAEIATTAGYTAASFLQHHATGAKPDYHGGEWARLIESNTLGHNLLGLSPLWKYTLFNELHEAMGSKGYINALHRVANQEPAMPTYLGGPGGTRGDNWHQQRHNLIKGN